MKQVFTQTDVSQNTASLKTGHSDHDDSDSESNETDGTKFINGGLFVLAGDHY